MELSGQQHIAAPRQRVWEALNDPAVLRACIPGCQSLEQDGPDSFTAVAEVKIGPIGARFKGKVNLTDIDAPNGYVITGQGNGGIAGNAKGRATVKLTDDGSGTMLAYAVDAEVGGRMAQLGGPIIDATARQLAGKFFAKFGEVVAGEASPAQPAAATSALIPLAQPAATSVAGASAFWPWLVALSLAITAGFLLGRSPAADWWVIAVIVLAGAAACAGYASGRRGGGAR